MARSEATKLTSRQLLSQAEPLGKTSQSTSVAFLIAIDPKIRVYGMARPSRRKGYGEDFCFRR